jgi:hypothetical protein
MGEPMSLKKENRKLREQNFMLKLEIWKLETKIEELTFDQWKHPRSCLHNNDPWENWNYLKNEK